MNLDIDKIYEIYFKRVYFYVKRIMGDVANNEDIEECVSDIFLSVWKESDKYDSTRGSLDTFINIKTRSIALNYRKKVIGKKIKFPIDTIDIFNIEVEQNLNTENKVIDNLNTVEIIEQIKKFKEPNRSYFYLRYFMNYEIKAIAKMFNTTVSSVDNRLYRCRLSLKKFLGKEVI